MRGDRRVAVLQPLPGIGDMIWHVPHIRALAEHVGAPVTVIAKPRSAAGTLFGAEAAVSDVMWVDRNPEVGRGRHDGPLGLGRLVADLRARAFDAVYLLHHSRILAFAAMAAGIPARHGFGFPLQRPFLNRPPFLPSAVLRMHPHEQATAWLAAAGIPLADTEPQLAILPQALQAVRQRLDRAQGIAGIAAGIAVIGIGSSEAYKQWGAERFASLAAGLRRDGRRLVLLGGRPEAGLADDIVSRLGLPTPDVLRAIGWDLAEVAALLSDADFYVGNDTGVMNLAAAVGTRTYGLFGATPPIHHSRRIVPILPPDGRPDRVAGMARITADAVLAVLRADPIVVKSERRRPAEAGAQGQAHPAVGPSSARTT